MNSSTSKRSLFSFAAICLLAALAVAQVKPGDAILALKNNSFNFPDGLTLVDLATGKGRVVPRPSTVNNPHISVALDPRHPGELWGSSSRIVAGFMSPIDHYIMKGDSIVGNGAGMGSVPLGIWGLIKRFHPYRDMMLITLSGGGGTDGVYFVPHSGGRMSIFHSIVDAYDIAVLKDKIYVSTFKAGTASKLYEIDMSATPSTLRPITLALKAGAPSGAKLPVTFNAMCADGSEGHADTLVLVDDKGMVNYVTPSLTLNTINSGVAGAGPVVAVVPHANPQTRLLLATTTKVYDLGNFSIPGGLGTPIFTSAYEIADMAHDLGWTGGFGKGCVGSNGRTPQMAFGGFPYQGNANHSLRMVSGPPFALVRLVLGLSDKTYSGSTLPLDLSIIGAPQCMLYTSILLDLATNLNAQGEVSIQAPIPVDSTLVGLRAFAQFGVGDTKANAAGLTTTDGLELIIR